MEKRMESVLDRSGTVFRSIRSNIIIFIVLFALIVFADIVAPGFMSFGHLNTISRQAAYLGIVSIGQTMVLISRGVDLSVGSTITVSSVMGAWIMSAQNENVPLALAVTLGLGLAIGLTNGLGIHFLKIPPLLMTLAMSSVTFGTLLVYTRGAPRGASAPILTEISTGRFMDTIHYSVLIWILLAAIAMLIMHKTVFGRDLYAVGANSTAAKYSGVKVGRTIITVYMISGFTAAVAGMLLIGFTRNSYLEAGNAFTFDSISAVVIGGTSVAGGSGGYVGTIAGAFIMIILISLLTIINIPQAGRFIVQGIIIIVMLLLIYRKGRVKGK